MSDIDRFVFAAYVAVDEGAPAGAVAHMWERVKEKGKPERLWMLPASVYRATPEQALSDLKAFITAELEKARRADEVSAARSERMRAANPKKGVAA